MLDGIDPLLTGDLLAVLDRMGHGDGIALVDAHFPHPRDQYALSFAGVNVPTLVRAICTVLPLDPDVPPAMMTAPGGSVDVQAEMADAAGVELEHVAFLERSPFYARAREAVAVVRTGEVRTYGNVVLHKGLVHL